MHGSVPSSVSSYWQTVSARVSIGDAFQFQRDSPAVIGPAVRRIVELQPQSTVAGGDDFGSASDTYRNSHKRSVVRNENCSDAAQRHSAEVFDTDALRFADPRLRLIVDRESA